MKRTVKATIIFVGIILLLTIVWGLVEPYTIDETHITTALPNLPQGWRGRAIAVISDLQVGMWADNTSTVRRIVDRILRRRPDLVLVLGDLIYHGGDRAEGRIETAVELLRPLAEADIKVITVLGNHDYSVATYVDPQVDEVRAARLTEALKEEGVIVLENEAITLEADGDGIHIIGVGSLMAQQSRPIEALRGLPVSAARLVMMHNPTSFDDLPAESAPLALAGHTHGGQFRLPLTPNWSWITFFRQEEVHADGWIKDYGAAGNRLYVNRGIGFSKIPMRLNCPPELTWIILEGNGG